MKTTLSFLFLLTLTFSIAQEPFKDGKKWGVSKYGNGDVEGDSVIFRADYEEVMPISTDYAVYAGLRNDEWIFLTSNKLVMQQRYENILPFEQNGRFACGIRAGYIDIMDFEANDFLIRTVKADGFSEEQILDFNRAITTYKEKDLYGVVHINSKKEILKAEYTSIIDNLEYVDISEGTFLAYKDAVNYFYDYAGNLIFTFKTPAIITRVDENDAFENCYSLYVESKKSELIGYYDATNKWYVPPVYQNIMFIEEFREMVIVQNDDGLGLYFQGEQILPCEYLSITAVDREGYVAIAATKKERYYVAYDGRTSLIKPEE